MAEITHIFGKDRSTPADCIDLPSDLEQLAARIRKGEENGVRGVLVFQASDTTVHHIALGEPVSLLEAVGLMGWAIEDIKNH